MNRLPSIANLMSPPEAKQLDDFSLTPAKSPSTAQIRGYTPELTLSPMAKKSGPEANIRVLPSPPVSPWMSKQKKMGDKAPEDGDGFNKDHVLFGDEASFESDGQPLFSSEPAKSTSDLIDRHIAMHMIQFKNKLNRPTHAEYRLALSCVPTIGTLYNRNPGAYMKRQREETEGEYWQSKRLCARAGTKAAPVAIAPAPKAGKRAIKPITHKAVLPRVKRTPKTSPMTKLMNYPPKGRSSETPDRVPGSKRDDVDYLSLPDYAPPTSNLGSNPKALKVDWHSSTSLNLDYDTDRHMLHEAEVNIASVLRLTCATYLCSKRRIFEARLNALRIGKEFRKTDAQQACKIDVNKASKLWSAFEKVGWFDPAYFHQFVKR